jgi:hypothetical protein
MGALQDRKVASGTVATKATVFPRVTKLTVIPLTNGSSREVNHSDKIEEASGTVMAVPRA